MSSARAVRTPSLGARFFTRAKRLTRVAATNDMDADVKSKALEVSLAYRVDLGGCLPLGQLPMVDSSKASEL